MFATVTYHVSTYLTYKKFGTFWGDTHTVADWPTSLGARAQSND